MIERIAADLHTHTCVSQHAYSTLYENIQMAERHGLCALGVTDHTPAMNDGADIGHFWNLQVIPRKVDGIYILRGAELNICDFNGKVDLPENVLREKLDYSVASMHDLLEPGTVDDHTQAYLALAENPLVHIIGHSGTVKYAYDYETVIKRFAQTGKIVEINEASYIVRKSSAENCRKIAQLCKKYGVRLSVDTDAHFCALVGIVPNSLRMLNEIDFPEELIINANKSNLKKWMKEDLGLDPEEE